MTRLFLKGLILSFAIWVFVSAKATAVEYVPGQVIVKFPGAKSLEQAKKRVDLNQYEVEKLVPELGLYLLKFKNSRMTVESALMSMRSSDSISYAQADHKLSLRMREPNDAEFAKQWNMLNTELEGADIKATEAWEIGTGGKDRSGNDIVIAIVDGGVDVNHEDLKANIWVNTNEIPGNDIDDDENGYVDDVNGWNAYSNNGNVSSNYHGTHVAGIAGARGDNELHVAGVNWNVKIMAVSGSSSSTSTVLRAYGYVLAQKKLYLETKGEKGANVVATNSSFGIDRAKCDTGDYPSWNDIYTAMGEVGILSAAAGPNANWDVDEVGDVPTGCDSDYLIAVTNTTKEDKLFKDSWGGACYGLKTIDLGAPGTKVVSTVPGNGVAPATGTSMATPHVAGSVALLHSVLSADFQSLVETSPAKGALQIKSILLSTVDPLEDLKEKTVSGGRLNLASAVKAAASFKLER